MLFSTEIHTLWGMGSSQEEKFHARLVAFLAAGGLNQKPPPLMREHGCRGHEALLGLTNQSRAC